uniref:Uncharacterized protein n=1 Tax=Arundo donax TaxID=35708 RepID=A0A0A9HXT8_ARUDO
MQRATHLVISLFHIFLKLIILQLIQRILSLLNCISKLPQPCI